jgi:uncharacterized protein with GYD domain
MKIYSCYLIVYTVPYSLGGIDKGGRSTFIIRARSDHGRRLEMSVYLMLTTLTDSGRKALQENPELLKEINKEVEFMGAKILTQYALLGQYDFVNILEAPNNEAIAKLAIRLSAKGTTQTLTLTAIPIDDLIHTLKSRENPW